MQGVPMAVMYTSYEDEYTVMYPSSYGTPTAIGYTSCADEYHCHCLWGNVGVEGLSMDTYPSDLRAQLPELQRCISMACSTSWTRAMLKYRELNLWNSSDGYVYHKNNLKSLDMFGHKYAYAMNVNMMLDAGCYDIIPYLLCDRCPISVQISLKLNQWSNTIINVD